MPLMIVTILFRFFFKKSANSDKVTEWQKRSFEWNLEIFCSFCFHRIKKIL